MHEQYGDRVAFQTIYIREAHPVDEWQMDSNVTENVCYLQPRSLPQRVAIANDFAKRFKYTVPLAVDTMDDHTEKIYAGWPERFYIINPQGVIVYKGKPGPFGFHPEEVEAWLAANAPPRTAALQ
jgi:iodothyronine deiodinase-like protein